MMQKAPPARRDSAGTDTDAIPSVKKMPGQTVCQDSDVAYRIIANRWEICAIRRRMSTPTTHHGLCWIVAVFITRVGPVRIRDAATAEVFGMNGRL